MTAFAAIKWARRAPVVRRADGKPDSTAHHVLIVLATYADKDGRGARPSLATVAEACCLTESTVESALRRLTAAGLIARELVSGGVTQWRLSVGYERGDELADEAEQRRLRARKLANERQRQYVRRSKVTQSESVTSDGVGERHVTQSETVTPGQMTQSDAVTDAVEDRHSRSGTPSVTQSTASSSQVAPRVTALELPVELPVDLPAERGSKDKPPRTSSKRATRIPPDFAVTPPMVAWARENAPDVDGRTETANFIDYWTAKPGAAATKLDWVATWRTWMRTAQQRAGGRSHLRVVGSHQPYRNPTNQDDYDGPIR